jgi:hypothetical protein
MQIFNMKYILSLVAILNFFSYAQPYTSINSMGWRGGKIFFYMPSYANQPELGVQTVFPRLTRKNPHMVLIDAPAYYDVQVGMEYDQRLMRKPELCMSAYMISEDCSAHAHGNTIYKINQAHTIHLAALLADWTNKLLSGTSSDQDYDDLCAKIATYYPCNAPARYSDLIVELEIIRELLAGLAEYKPVVADNPTFSLTSLTAWIVDMHEVIKENSAFDQNMSIIDFFNLIIDGSKLEGNVQAHAEKCKQFAAKLDRVLELCSILEAVYMIFDYEPAEHGNRPIAVVSSPSVCHAIKDILS